MEYVEIGTDFAITQGIALHGHSIIGTGAALIRDIEIEIVNVVILTCIKNMKSRGDEMRLKVWIVNHYATNMYFDKCGRHFGLVKYLDKDTYDITIVCADQAYQDVKKIEMKERYKCIQEDGISWCFIKTVDFQGNGFGRIRNMYSFYKGLKHVIKKEDKPDIIVGSNVHLLACLFSVKMKKKYPIKSIVEMRDLWPECFLDSKLGKIKPLMNFLYWFERYLYEHTDAIIGTLEGIQDYIATRHKKAIIEDTSIFYINNGVDKERYEHLKVQANNLIVETNDKIRLVYTGTINFANGIQHIVTLGKKLEQLCDDVEIIVYGAGNYQNYFMNTIASEHIRNLKYMGKIERDMVPAVLKQADFLLLNYGNQAMFRWGESQNKLFEYMAAEKPILSNVETQYDIVKKHNLGIYYDVQDDESIKNIVDFIHMDKKTYNKYCDNARACVEEYDYARLAKKYEDVFQYVSMKKEDK